MFTAEERDAIRRVAIEQQKAIVEVQRTQENGQ